MTIKDKDIVVGPDQRGFNPEPNYDSRFPVLVPTSPSAPPEGLRNRQSSYARLKGPNSNEVLSQLASLNSVLLHQDVNRLEAITCGCVEQQNIYRVLHPETEETLLIARENSETWPRVCCDPHQSLFLEIALPATPTSSEEVLYTAERQGCCGAKPCLVCCACTDSCTDAMTLHEGRLEGKPGELRAPRPLLMMRQEKAFESPWKPKLEVMPIDQSGFEQSATHHITGPACFGGCCELCTESEWEVNGLGGENMGLIKKLRPKDAKAFAREFGTDADRYSVEFGPSDDALTKLSTVVSTLLLDYMFFEHDLGICRPKWNGGCETTICNWYLCGMTCPCKCSTGDKNNNNSWN
ncbi:hypothetical protein ScalyP_jg8843 [Parmales sp. scaly parma]|nr:hypothetical protein ScalyP_jg8843 [Parmales sp. scaly parma]